MRTSEAQSITCRRAAQAFNLSMLIPDRWVPTLAFSARVRLRYCRDHHRLLDAKRWHCRSSMDNVVRCLPTGSSN